MAAQRNQEALDLLNDWINRGNWYDQESRYLMAQAYTGLQRYPEALRQYESLLTASPEEVDYLLGKGDVLIRQGRYLESMKPLEEARRLDGKRPEVWRLQIEAMHQVPNRNHQRLAHQLQKSARKRFPKLSWEFPDIEFYGIDGREKGMHALQLQRYDRAVYFLSAWIQHHSDDLAAKEALALALFRQDKRQQALGLYDELLHSDADNVEWLLGSLRILVLEHRPLQAIEVAQRIRDLDPNRREAWRLEIQALNDSADVTLQQQAHDRQAQARNLFPSSRWNLSSIRIYPGGRTLDQLPKQTELEFSYGNEQLTQGFPEGDRYYFGAARELNGGKVLYGYYTHIHTLGLEDDQGLVGLYLPINDYWYGLLEYSGSDSCYTIACNNLLLQLQYASEYNSSLYFGTRYLRNYVSQGTGVELSLDHYWGNTGLVYAYQLVPYENHYQYLQHKVQLRHYYGQNNVVLTVDMQQERYPAVELNRRYAYYHGYETYLEGSHWLSRYWALTYSVGVYQYDIYYRKRWLTTGVKWRF